MFATVSIKKNSRGNKDQVISSRNAATAAGRRAPGPGHFFNFKKRASEQASEQGGWARSARAGQRASLRAVREQASVDVSPVVRGQWRNFTDVGEQAEDR